jgi:transcriptional regulator with XRE-family HTH domain
MSRRPFDVETLGAAQEEVAQRLRAVRESMGLSLRSFADRLTSSEHHVSHVAVMKYEHLELRITPDYLELVSMVTGVPYGWFLSGVGSEDSPPSPPALHSAGLDFLPTYHHRWITERLERLANWCGIPPGPALEEFYGQVGAVLRGPFGDDKSYLRPWRDLSDRELSVYLATQFATLRTLLRRLGVPDGVSPTLSTDPDQGSPPGEDD